MENRQAEKITVSQTIEQFEYELAHPENRSNSKMIGVITHPQKASTLLDWLVDWLSQNNEPSDELRADTTEIVNPKIQ